MITSALFGSGVSYVSEIPSIGVITEKILSGDGVGREADSIYYLNQGQRYLQHHISDNLKLINALKTEIELFYVRLGENHTVNYEDLYYLLKQIADSYHMEFENPGVNSLLEKLEGMDEFAEKKLRSITLETIKYIQSIVWQMIAYRKISFDQFQVIPEWIEEFNLKSIFSLNHDLVLENYLEQNNISYDDGFKNTQYKYPQWMGFSTDKDHLKLYKLHGSVDWFEIGVLKPQRSNEIFKLPLDIYVQGVHREEEAFWGTTDGTPKLLIGTFNKMLGYLSDIFETLYDSFKATLRESNKLIISGYGFGDKGINTQLSHWLNQENAEKMIIIHPYKDDLILHSRGNYRLNFMNADSKHPKVELIEKKFEEVTTAEIKEVLQRIS